MRAKGWNKNLLPRAGKGGGGEKEKRSGFVRERNSAETELHIETAQFGSAKLTSRIFVDVDKNISEGIFPGSIFAEMKSDP